MSNEYLPKRLLYVKQLVVKHPAGRPKMQFKDSLKMSLKDLEIPLKTWERLASNWVRSQEKSWLLKTIMQLRPHAHEPKENPELQATCGHTKLVNHRCGHHRQSMSKQHLSDVIFIGTDLVSKKRMLQSLPGNSIVNFMCG